MTEPSTPDADPTEVRAFLARSNRAQLITGVLHALAVLVAALGAVLALRGSVEPYAGLVPYLIAAVAFEAAAEVAQRVLERFYVMPAFPGGLP